MQFERFPKFFITMQAIMYFDVRIGRYVEHLYRGTCRYTQRICIRELRSKHKFIVMRQSLQEKSTILGKKFIEKRSYDTNFFVIKDQVNWIGKIFVQIAISVIFL